MNSAVFLDKDGTIIPDIPYNADTTKISLYPEVAEALLKLRNAGYLLILVSNQPGVALGYFKEGELIAVFKRINQLLSESKSKVMLDGFYYCPHHPKAKIRSYKQECNCRKPNAGLMFSAASFHKIDLPASWMIGDILDDVEAGNRAGCKSILINNGNETEWSYNEFRHPDFIATSVKEASDYILNH